MPIISELFVYPIKSCAGIAPARVRLGETGFDYDRNWMLVDAAGAMLTQRVHPRLALVKPAFGDGVLTISAPGRAPLTTPLAAHALLDSLAGAPTVAATVWKDTVEALDTGAETAAWFSDFLGFPARLVRFAPSARREVSRKWTGEFVSTTQFADGYPLLVLGQASLDDLNARLAARGAPRVPVNRFRPNIVVTGLDPYEEDYVERLEIDANGVPVDVRLVKLCTRCPMPTIDQQTGAPDPAWPHEPLDTMQAYRANPRFDGALTFGNNGIVVAGSGTWLEVGMTVNAELGFDA